MNNKNSKTDKIAGTIKEKTGKVIDSEQLELEGKLQKKRGEMKEANKKAGENIKETAAEKLNNVIDNHDKKER